MSHTDFAQQNRQTLSPTAAPACVAMQGMVLCPMWPNFPLGIAASWAQVYRAAYESADRKVRLSRFRRDTQTSSN